MESNSLALTRRGFLRTGALGAGALLAGASLGRAYGAPAIQEGRRPNVLMLFTDQQGLDTVSACGCPDARTPNIDRLAGRGVSFMESHSADPLCSPGRSSIITGRMPSETGVITNGLAVRASIPNLGQWLGQNGYESVWAGKWHIPASYTFSIPGFKVISTGIGGQGETCDATVSRACEAYLRNRSASRNKPFYMVASFLQPHDICQFISAHAGAPDVVPFKDITNELPPLPPNHQYDPCEPRALAKKARLKWSEQQWRYYLWSYYRMVEMADAEIGRILQALEDCGELDNTLVFLTADHGEGRGRHKMVTKNFLYDEAVKVPMIVSFPGHAQAGARDTKHLVSGTDVVKTVCDYTGVAAPPRVLGASMRPLLEGKAAEWHEFIAAEVTTTGRMIRTPDYKLIAYYGDPVEQLFDMKNDPGETKNLAPDSKFVSILEDHHKLLKQWEAKLDLAPKAAEALKKAPKKA